MARIQSDPQQSKSGSTKLVRHGLLVMSIFHIGSVSNLAFQLVAGRTLSKAEYGTLYTMLGLLMILMIPMQALQTTLAHFVRNLQRTGSEDNILGLVRLWERKLLIFLLPLMLISVGASPALAGLLHLASPWPLILVFVSAFMFAFLQVYSGALQGVQRFVPMCLTSNGWGILKLAAGFVAMVWIAPLAVSGLSAQVLAKTTIVAASFILLRKYFKGPVQYGKAIVGVNTYFSMSVLALLTFSVLMNSDVVLVKILFPSETDYGDYTRASAITRMMIFLVQPLAMTLFPKVVSKGDSNRDSRFALLKAIILSGLLLSAAVVVCAVFPKIPLAIIFGKMVDGERTILLIRLLALAMAPLGISFILLNYELAQHRFRFLIPLSGCAILFVAGATIYHPSLRSIAIWLAAASYTSAVLLAWDLISSDRLRSRVDFDLRRSRDMNNIEIGA